MSKLLRWIVCCGLLMIGSNAVAQFDITTQPVDAEGPWSDVEQTTLMVPQVADGSITLDGVPSDSEYGGFAGVTVTPGINAWIHNFPGDRQWDNSEDSSFTFWLAHDTTYFYVGVDVADDVVNSDDPNGQFWRDDAIEIVTDVWNDNYDNNTDSSNDAYGGHSYINYEGRFSAWNEDTESIDGERWSSAVDDWTWGNDPAKDTEVTGCRRREGRRLEHGSPLRQKFVRGSGCRNRTGRGSSHGLQHRDG